LIAIVGFLTHEAPQAPRGISRAAPCIFNGSPSGARDAGASSPIDLTLPSS
jgi:hypothetical protein